MKGGAGMKPIKERMRKTNTEYIFHNTKEDVRTLAKYCNMLADKINELNKEVQELKEQLKGGAE